jgi:arylsulfatase A-like enzyme
VSTIDIYSTLSDILTGELSDPKKAAPDSFSFYSILRDHKRPSERDYIIHRDAPGRQAIRVGPWKLVLNEYPNNFGKPIQKRGQKELYNLNSDPEEKNNLYKSMPEKAKDMENIYRKARSSEYTRVAWSESFQN